MLVKVILLKRYIIGLFLLVILIFIPVSVFKPFPFLNHFSPEHTPHKDSPEKESSLRVAAFGDIMMHSPQLTAGIKNDGSYDFHSFFKEISPYLQSADVTIGNLELTLKGQKPYQGYPMFNAPDAIVDAIKDAGVDVVSTANNHAMDTGVQGVKRTYRVVNQAGILTTGTAPSANERTAAIVEKKGIKIAFLAYTEATNGIPVPAPYLVNRIDPQRIKQDIAAARKQGADYVFASLHFGYEYHRQPNEYQKRVAYQALKDGADAILGSHPHVVQPMEKVMVDGKEKFIIYSMGNFVSNQTDPYTDEGIILYIDIVKKGKYTRLKDVSFLPTYVHKYRQHGKRQYVILPLENALPQKVPAYPGLTRNKLIQSYRHTWDLITQKDAFPVFSLTRR